MSSNTSVLPTDRRPKSQFTNRVSLSPKARFPFEPGRYRLIVSYACPFAHRTLLASAMCGLDNEVPILALPPVMDDRGWRLPDGESGANLMDLYRSVVPDYAGRATVPVLQDLQSGKIVSNDSGQIMRMLETVFCAAKPGAPELAPKHLLRKIAAANQSIHRTVNDMVYKVAFAPDAATADFRRKKLYQALTKLDRKFEKQAFVLGEEITEPDLRLWPSLVRFDIAYRRYLDCGPAKLSAWPNLSLYAERLGSIPQIASTLHVADIEQHFAARRKQLDAAKQAGSS